MWWENDFFVRILNIYPGELMIETFEFFDRNSCLQNECKDNLIEDARIVWQTKDTIIICGGLCQRLISKE